MCAVVMLSGLKGCRRTQKHSLYMGTPCYQKLYFVHCESIKVQTLSITILETERRCAKATLHMCEAMRNACSNEGITKHNNNYGKLKHKRRRFIDVVVEYYSSSLSYYSRQCLTCC